MQEFHETLLEMLRAGRPLATATIVKVTGSTPRAVGARMIVPVEGEPCFTLGGGLFEADVVRDAREAILMGAPLLKVYSLADRGGDGEGQECGGTVTVFIEPAGPSERLWIFGAGHVGRCLAAAARGLGFEITVFDDRPEYADIARLPGAQHAVRTDPEYRDGVLIPDDRTYCVIVTRAHRTDRAALRAGLSGTAAWVGMIGSVRKRLAIHKELSEQDGIAPDRLERVETPVGLSIGAETPEEIAISILARLIQVRRSGSTPDTPKRP